MISDKEVKFMMDVAYRASKESNDDKVRVGAVVAKDRNILAYGYNGTASGSNNVMRGSDGKTLPTVIHAEQNAIAKLAKSTQSGEGAAMFSTHFPCMNCALSIIQAGITDVYYHIDYKCMSALALFEECGVKTHKV